MTQTFDLTQKARDRVLYEAVAVVPDERTTRLALCTEKLDIEIVP